MLSRKFQYICYIPSKLRRFATWTRKWAGFTPIRMEKRKCDVDIQGQERGKILPCVCVRRECFLPRRKHGVLKVRLMIRNGRTAGVRSPRQKASLVRGRKKLYVGNRGF